MRSPSVRMRIWPSRLVTTREPSGVSTATTRSKPTVPSSFDFRWVWAAIRAAVPPMWNVRSVSCVPGSPIDWAATMPTTSPISTVLPVARLRP